MKLLEDIELRLSDAYQQSKQLAERDESMAFISEEQLFSYDLALEHFKESVQAEYDILCPKPSEFNNYDWTFINMGGWIYTSAKKPIYDAATIYGEDIHNIGRAIYIPLGIDWRLCYWSIEDAKRIHGEDE